MYYLRIHGTVPGISSYWQYNYYTNDPYTNIGIDSFSNSSSASNSVDSTINSNIGTVQTDCCWWVCMQE